MRKMRFAEAVIALACWETCSELGSVQPTCVQRSRTVSSGVGTAGMMESSCASEAPAAKSQTMPSTYRIMSLAFRPPLLHESIDHHSHDRHVRRERRVGVPARAVEDL